MQLASNKHKAPTSGATPFPAARQTDSMSSYRCRQRAYDQACETDPALDTFIQLKAPNAVEAARLARLVTPPGASIVEVERQDA